MAKQDILNTIEQDIVQNDDGNITAQKVKGILDSIVSLLPSDDASGSPATKEIVKNYLKAGTDITLTESSGKLEIAFDGTLLDTDAVQTIIDSHVKAGNGIALTTNDTGNLVVSITGENLTKKQVLKSIKPQQPLIASYDDTSQELSLTAGSYDPNPAFNNSATLEAIRSHGLYTLAAYNLALYDSFNVDPEKFMLPPKNASSQGILINLYEVDTGFLDYVEADLVAGIYQKNNDGTLHTIIEGTIAAVNNPNQRKLYLSLTDTSRGDPIRDINVAQPLYCMQVSNKIQTALDNTKDDIARQQVQVLAQSLAGITDNANTAKTQSAAAQTTANTSLARTQRLNHITPWVYDGTARTLHIQWKPVKGLSSSSTLTIRIEGISKTFTLTEGLPANDDHGLLIPFAATTADAANILRNAVNARAGYLLCQVEDSTNGTSDYCWIPVVPSMEWTTLTGNSPYSIANHYKEFVFEYGKDTNKVYTQHVLRQQIPATAKTFLSDTERPDGGHQAELGVVLTLSGSQLTASVRQQDTSDGTHTIKNIYAR